MSVQPLPIYLINIERATDRLDEMRRQFVDLSIDFTRIDGVDGQTVSPEQWIDVDERLFRSRHGRKILPGEYGCYRSHLLALERFLESDHPAAIILEDDIQLDDRLLSRAVSLLQAAPAADVIKLVNHRWKGFKAVAHSSDGDVLGRCLFGPQGSTACYLVTRIGAAKVLKNLRVMSLPWDVAIERGWDCETSVYSTRANLVGFSRLRRKTMIGSRKTYLAAKLSPWRRIPAHIFRTVDFFRRLTYVLASPRPRPAEPAASHAGLENTVRQMVSEEAQL